VDRFFEVVHPVTCVEKLSCERHEGRMKDEG
jgi:hypothetical protein